MKIVLIGAYGFTGKIVCDILDKEGISFSIAGRDLEKLKELKSTHSQIEKIHQTDLTDTESSSSLIGEYDIFINLAGPYTEESSGFLSQIAHSKDKYYLDASGELGYIKDSRVQFDKLAQSNKTLIIHGCAFESLPADLIRDKINAALGGLNSINSYYRFENSTASPGTKMTMKLAKYRTIWAIRNGKWTGINVQEQIRPFGKSNETELLSVPYPLPEVAFNMWSGPIEESMSYLVMEKNATLFLGQNKSEGDTAEVLKKLKALPRREPSIEQRKKHSFELTVSGKFNDKEKAYVLKGIDMYGLTAKIIVESVKRIKNSPQKYGVQPPSVLFSSDIESELNALGIHLAIL